MLITTKSAAILYEVWVMYLKESSHDFYMLWQIFILSISMTEDTINVKV